MEVLAGARYRQGLLQGRLEAMEPGSRTEAEVGAVTREALDTSGIEGERLNTKQVRESASRRLSIDLERAGDPEQHEDGLVAMLLDATAGYREELTEERILGWHSWLFPNGMHGDQPVRAGAWRTGPTRVISGLMARERVLPGPEPEQIPSEMRAFLEWFNSPPETDGVIRAGTAHLWFAAVHPFEDGNGRIARALSDMALARSNRAPRASTACLTGYSGRGTRTTTHWRTPPRGPATSPPGSAGSPGASAGPWTTPWRRCPRRRGTPP